MTHEEVLGAALNYTDKTVEGGGALKGKNCTIKSISAITGGHRVTFEWTLNDGTKDTAYMDVMDGAEGEKGEKGDRGAIGPAGSQGIQGVQGPAGPKGDTGAQGPAGPQGVQGIQGIQGPKGDDGYPFLIYRQYNDISEFSPSHFPEIGLLFMVMQEDFDPSDPSVSIGYPIYRFLGQGTPPYSLVVHLASQGIKGDKGDKGDTGAQGPQGLQGIQGEKGDKGDKGDTGAQGVQGEQGIGLPDGGTTGQVLVKYSNEDYDFDWKDTTDRVRPNSHALVESIAVYSAINEALNTIYTPRGDLTCAELTSSLLIEANVGNVYQMTDSGETSALFINGAGITINVNDNVGIIKAGPNTILFNYMGNAFDLHDYQKKDLTQAVEGETTVESALGALSTNKQPETLHNPITVDGVQKTTVEAALSALVSKKVYYEISTANDPTAIETNFKTLMPQGVNLVFWRKGGSHEVLIVQNTDADYYSYLWFSYGQPLYQRIHTPVGWSTVFNGRDSYSTNETLTSKVWINGKPIYRKAFGYTSVVTTGSSAIIGTIDNMADIVNIYGTFRNNNDNNVFPIGYTFSNNSGVVAQNFPFVLHSDGKLYANAFGFNIKDINVVVEYTKTT